MHCNRMLFLSALCSILAGQYLIFGAKTKDLYEILGVKRTATQKAIRSSFRKLALTHHPDKNKNDPNAEKKFVEITKAYEILSDNEKREQYDKFGDIGEGQNGFDHSTHSFNFDDIFGTTFDSFFSYDHRSSQNSQGGEQYIKVNDDDHFFRFEDVFNDEDDDDAAFLNFDPFEDWYEQPHTKYERQPHTKYERQANEEYMGNFFSSSSHASGGSKCRTVTQRIGNMITTRTECS